MAKRDYFGVLEGLGGTVLSVHQNRCIMVRNGNVSCMRCAEACTSGCLSMVDGELVVDQERCVGCGTCAAVCPTCAIDVRVPADAQLLDCCIAASRDGFLRIACRTALDGCEEEWARESAAVACLGRVEESLLVSLAARGIGKVELACGGCEQCSCRPGRTAAEAACVSASRLLGAWGSAFAWSFTAREPSRRLSLSSLPSPSFATVCERDVSDSREPARAPSRRAHVTGDGTLPHFQPERHEAVINALTALGAPSAESLESRLWGTVTINPERCQGCRLCSVFCPTGALARFTEADGSLGLRHYPVDCVQCRCCEQVCRHGALRVTSDVGTDVLVSGRGTVLEVGTPLRDPRAPDSMRQAMQERCRAVVSEKS